ncbi:unnamed protein product [Linum trigynum]|uniref:Uncharacterized protein n=1 Tax=Linum trigynum TaxID=586398 RepID=A0AAV2EAG3_9ROSI
MMAPSSAAVISTESPPGAAAEGAAAGECRAAEAEREAARRADVEERAAAARADRAAKVTPQDWAALTESENVAAGADAGERPTAECGVNRRISSPELQHTGRIQRLVAGSSASLTGRKKEPMSQTKVRRWVATTTNDRVASPGMQHVERTQWTSAADSNPGRPLRGLTMGKEMKSERPTKKKKKKKKKRVAPLTANVKKKKPGPGGARCRRVLCSLLEKKAKDCSPTEVEKKKNTPLLEDETRKDDGGVSSRSNPQLATLGRTEQQRKAGLGRKIWVGWPETQSETGRINLEQGRTIVELGSDLLVHSIGPRHGNNQIEAKLSLGPNSKGTHWVQKKTGLSCQSGPGPPTGFVLKWVSLEKKKGGFIGWSDGLSRKTNPKACGETMIQFNELNPRKMLEGPNELVLKDGFLNNAASWNSLSGWSEMPTIEELLKFDLVKEVVGVPIKVKIEELNQHKVGGKSPITELEHN